MFGEMGLAQSEELEALREDGVISWHCPRRTHPRAGFGREACCLPRQQRADSSKVFDAGSDAVALDLEDAVPDSLKGDARELVAAAIDAQVERARAPRIIVRVTLPTPASPSTTSRWR